MNVLKAMRSMVQWQLLPYDFKYCQQDFQVDYRFFLVSDSKVKIRPTGNDAQKQLLTFDTPINIRRTDEEVTVPWKDVFEENLDDFKVFIEAIRLQNTNDVCLTADESKELEESWVKNRPKYTTDDLHRWLAIARILKLCYKENFQVQKVVTLENCRLATAELNSQ